MASARALTRGLRSTPAAAAFRKVAARSLATIPQRGFQQQAYSRHTNHGSSWSSFPLFYSGFAASIIIGAGLYASNRRQTFAEEPETTQPDYQAVYDAIAERLIEEDDYDDGSYGPIVLRLAWHASGTYDEATGTGGSNGATMRFSPEKDHGANRGMEAARNFLEPIKEQFPWISYGDLWTLAAVCAVQEMGGPTIPWRPGRQDKEAESCTPDGRLPLGGKNHDHLRAIFGRMGFNDQEIVALSGAHALGRCHVDRSGFDGPWTFSPITLTNEFYKLLLDEKWHERDWKGPRQFQDDSTKSLMMLPTDMALVEDEGFRPYVEKYAGDEEVFFNDFSKVVTKLFELGVPFTTSDDERIEFERTE